MCVYNTLTSPTYWTTFNLHCPSASSICWCSIPRLFFFLLPAFLPQFTSHYLFHCGPLLMYSLLCMLIYCTCTLLFERELCLCRQAWVEGPLGSGSRYCKMESALYHCSSREQWGEQNQSKLITMQDFLHSSLLCCLVSNAFLSLWLFYFMSAAILSRLDMDFHQKTETKLKCFFMLP